MYRHSDRNNLIIHRMTDVLTVVLAFLRNRFMPVKAVRGRKLLGNFFPVLAHLIGSSISEDQEDGKDTTSIAVGAPDKHAG